MTGIPDIMLVRPEAGFERPLSEGGKRFNLKSDFQPAGDQPQAIAALCEGLEAGERDQVLLGVTGSGKTFTMAHVIQNCSGLRWCSRPTRPWRRSFMAK